MLAVATATIGLKREERFSDIQFDPLQPPEKHPFFAYHGFYPGKKTTLLRGHVKETRYQAFRVDVIWEQDVSIEMRNKVKLYADIFRPAMENARVPAIIPWSPYGKTGTGVFDYDHMVHGAWGIPYQNLSGYEKFGVGKHLLHKMAYANNIQIM